MKRKLVFLAAIAGFAVAGPPTITDLQPRGVERGRSFTLTLIGRDLPEAGKISSSLPATFTPVSSSSPAAMMAGEGRSASFLVEPKDNVAPGIYTVRVQGPDGISNILMLSVGNFPEQTEEESQQYSQPNRNDTIETAQTVQTVPVTINGTLRGPERDLYRIYGKAGERRVIEVEARRRGSAIDPVLRVLDGAGKQLARNEDAPGIGLDARLHFTFPREGYYYVEVHDARFSRQMQNAYRLTMGNYAFAEGIFPLGGRRGERTEVMFFGGNLPASTKATIVGKAELDRVVLPNSPASSFVFATSDLPELVEPKEAVPVPSVVNGRLFEPGRIDKYKLAVQPGDKLLFEVQARELGTSKLEAVLTAYDQKGKKLDSAGDKPLPEDVFAVQGTSRTSNDPFLNLTVPEGVTELTIAIEDLAARGGPLYGYRLITRKQAQDFTLALSSPFVNVPIGGSVAVAAVADRRGYDGPIQLKVENLPKGMAVEGGIIPRETVDLNNTRSVNRRGVMVLTSEAGSPMPVSELVIYGEATLPDGTVLRRRARGSALTVDVAGATAQGVVDRQRSITAPWLGFDLPAATGEAPLATLELKERKVTRMEEGDKYDYEYRWVLKSREATVPKDISVEVVGARDIRVTNMVRNEEGGTFSVNTSKATEPAKYDVIARGRVKLENREEEIFARPLTFTVPDRSTPVNVSSVR